MKAAPNTCYYYGAYDISKVGSLVGIAYVNTGKRGGKKPARWFHPVNKLVTSQDRKSYKFYFIRLSGGMVDWVVDGIQRDQGRHLES